IAAATITDANVAAANKDGAAGTASMRTLGTGSAQAAAGNDTRFPVTVYLTSDATVASTTPVTALSTASLAAGTYLWEASGEYSVSATTASLRVSHVRRHPD